MPKHSKFIALASAVSLSVLATSASAQVSGSVQVQGGFGVSVPGQVVVNQPQVQPVGGQVVVVGQPQPQPLQTQVVVQQPRPIGPAVDQFGRPIGATAVDQFGRPIGGNMDTLARPIAQPVAVPVGPMTQPQTINLQVPLQPQGQPDRYVPPSQPGQVWVPGGWQFVNGQQQWIAGHWETPPQPGQVWMQPQQGRRGRRWWYRQGYWGQPQQIGNQYLQPGAFGIQAQVRPYQLGQIMTGALDTTDFHSPNGGYADDYAVFLQAGQPVTFVVTGGPSTQNGQLLDVVASLHFQGRELASDDDGAGYPHARLVFTPRVSGVYALRVASYGARYDTGSYSIQSWAGAMQAAQPFAPVQNWGWSGTQPIQPQPQPVQVQPIQPQPVQQPGIMGLNIGTQIQGMLQPGDSLNQRGSYVDQYAINLFAGQPITIVARGVGTVGPMGAMNNTPDVMLDLVCNGQQVGHDDDSAGNHNARLVITPQQNTQCVVQVSTFGGTRTVGAYQLVTVQGAQPSMQ